MPQVTTTRRRRADSHAGASKQLGSRRDAGRRTSDARRRAQPARRPLRPRGLPPGSGRGDRGAARGTQCARGLPDRGGQEPLLPASCAAARRRDGGRLAADRADEGPDRLPRRARRRRGAARLEPRRRRGRATSPSGSRAGELGCSTSRPSASPTSGSSRSSRGRRDRALRGRRGALHLRVGPQLPPRLPQARAACAASSAPGACWR